MKIFQLLLLSLVVTVFSKNSLAQGCSDAGFCTIGNLNKHSKDDFTTKKQRISLLLNNGIGDESVYVFTPGIQYDNVLNKNWAIQAKLTGNFASGNLGNAGGLGDLYISTVYSLSKRKKWLTSILLGVKLPLNSGNIKVDGKSLPMQYQSSLGTVDIITGLSVSSKHWLFATGLQLPITGSNNNNFLPAYWNSVDADKYIPTNDFNRKADVLLKAVYVIGSAKKLNLNVGLLGIYHVEEDTYIDGNLSNNPIELTGSQGLTLNLISSLRYNINSKISLGLSAGVPLVVRDIRPDGLTRKFSISPEFIFQF